MTDPDIVEARKRFGRIVSDSRHLAKMDRCLLCGKKTTKFCDSHTIPQLVLKNIETGGKLDYYNSFMANPLENMDQGRKEVTQFRLICSECDGKWFQEYEDEEKLKNLPTERMLNLIALKNVLFFLNKRYFEIEFNRQMNKGGGIDYYEYRQNVKRLDTRDFLWDFDRIREMLDGSGKRYNLISWDRVEYKVPIAFQGQFSVYGDRVGNIVVDIYDHSEKIINKRMHMCVFPLSNCSVIFSFYHEDDHEYDEFAEQIRKMEVEERLSFLGYLLFYICEDMAISKQIPHRTYFYQKVRNMFTDAYDFYTDDKQRASYLMSRHRNMLKRWTMDTFPGVLTQKYALKE